MRKSMLPSLFAAAVIGGLYHLITVNFWGSYVVTTPVNQWLLDTLARQGYPAAYRIGVSVHDLIVNFFLALPVAATFLVFKSLNNWRSVATAAISAIIVGYSDVGWEALLQLLSSWRFWLGLAMAAFSLPLAFAGIHLARPSGVN